MPKPVVIPKEEFVKEHKKLLSLFKKIEKESKKQKAELIRRTATSKKKVLKKK